MSFYLPDSDDHYLNSVFWKNERDYLLSQNCQLLNTSQANNYDLTNFFNKNVGDTKPRLNQSYGFSPLFFELDEMIGDLSIEEIIIILANENLNGKVLCASMDSDKCCFIECENLTVDILCTLSSTHLNTPFIIFDLKFGFFILIDFDLPLQIIGFENSIPFKNKVELNGWDTVFTRYSNYTNMPNIFNEYYSFLLPN